MMGRILGAYSVEIMKAVRLRFTYVGPVLVILIIFAAPFAHPIAVDGKSDYGFIAYTMPLALNVVGLLLLLIYCANLISSELSAGTIRNVLVRPLRRSEFVLAKLLTGLTYALCLSALAAASVWAVCYGLGELAGVRYGGEVIYTDREMQITFALALMLNFLPTSAGVAYALFVSCCTKNPAAAGGIAVGLWFLVDAVKYPLNIAPILFSSYMESPWQVFSDRSHGLEAQWMPAVEYAAVTSIGAFCLFTLLSIYVISRRSLTA